MAEQLSLFIVFVHSPRQSECVVLVDLSRTNYGTETRKVGARW